MYVYVCVPLSTLPSENGYNSGSTISQLDKFKKFTNQVKLIRSYAKVIWWSWAPIILTYQLIKILGPDQS